MNVCIRTRCVPQEHPSVNVRIRTRCVPQHPSMNVRIRVSCHRFQKELAILSTYLWSHFSQPAKGLLTGQNDPDSCNIN